MAEVELPVLSTLRNAGHSMAVTVAVAITGCKAVQARVCTEEQLTSTGKPEALVRSVLGSNQAINNEKEVETHGIQVQLSSTCCSHLICICTQAVHELSAGLAGDLCPSDGSPALEIFAFCHYYCASERILAS